MVWVLVFALLTAGRIAFGAMALPLFTNVDEQAHYDLVHKFATGRWPGAGPQRYDEETSRTIALYGTPEYLMPRAQAAARRLKPMWMAPPALRDAWLPQAMSPWTTVSNHEAHSPPAYYALAGAWYRAGQFVGLREASLAYWVRLLNVLLYPAVVVVAYCFVKRFYPGQPFLHLAVPAVLAAWPQDVFYAINNDVASPLAFAVALYLLLEWLGRSRPAPGLAVAAGLAVAVAMLVKTSNVAILAICTGVVVAKVVAVARAGTARSHVGELVLISVAAAAPNVAWVERNLTEFGDPTGAADKARQLGWTYKPIGEWFHHPMFTADGLGFFAFGLTRHFWRGETLWHAEPSAPLAFDVFFAACTLGLMAAAAFALATRRHRAGPDAWLLAAVATSVLFLAVLSLLFDFGDCVNPSRERPFFIAGRLMIGALVPFVILLLRGLDVVAARAPLGMRVLFVAVLCGACLLSRYDLLSAAYASEFNWFHLR